MIIWPYDHKIIRSYDDFPVRSHFGSSRFFASSSGRDLPWVESPGHLPHTVAMTDPAIDPDDADDCWDLDDQSTRGPEMPKPTAQAFKQNQAALKAFEEALPGLMDNEPLQGALRLAIDILRGTQDSSASISPRSEGPLGKPSFTRSISPAAVLNLLERLQSDGVLDSGSSSSQTLGVVALLLVPIVVALTGVGFKLAREISKDFFVLSPLLFASSFNLFAFTSVLLWKAGMPGVRRLFARRYALVVISAFAGAFRYILQLLALRQLSSSLFFVIMKTCMLWCSLAEAVHFQRLPTKLKAVTVVGVLLSCSAYVAKNIENSASGVQAPVGALALSFAAALCDAIADAFSEIAAKAFTEGMDAKERDVELTRFVVAEQFWRVVCYLGAVVIFEGDSVFEKGIAHGYTWGVLVYAVIPIILKAPIFQFCVFRFGALVTNMAGSLDMGVAYASEIALGWASLVISEMLIISTTAIILIMGSLHTMEVQRELVDANKGFIAQVERHSKRESTVGEDSEWAVM